MAEFINPKLIFNNTTNRVKTLENIILFKKKIFIFSAQNLTVIDIKGVYNG
jgi:hypothetical protein